jgi:hypothetical protein
MDIGGNLCQICTGPHQQRGCWVCSRVVRGIPVKSNTKAEIVLSPTGFGPFAVNINAHCLPRSAKIPKESTSFFHSKWWKLWKLWLQRTLEHLELMAAGVKYLTQTMHGDVEVEVNTSAARPAHARCMQQVYYVHSRRSFTTHTTRRDWESSDSTHTPGAQSAPNTRVVSLHNTGICRTQNVDR